MCLKSSEMLETCFNPEPAISHLRLSVASVCIHDTIGRKEMPTGFLLLISWPKYTPSKTSQQCYIANG